MSRRDQGDLFGTEPLALQDIRNHGHDEVSKVAAERHAPRRGSQCDKILERLKLGPATSPELAEIAPRFGARVYDLRQLGWRIESRVRGAGVAVYRLLDERNTV